MPPPCVGPTSYGPAAFSPVAVGWNRFFPPFTVTPAASVHPSFACGLQLSASVILFFGCFRCLSTAVLSFVFSYLYVFFRALFAPLSIEFGRAIWPMNCLFALLSVAIGLPVFSVSLL